MKRARFFGLFSVIIGITCITFACIALDRMISEQFDRLNQSIKNSEQYIGRKVDLDGDTLTIIRSGIGTVTLSNGVEVEDKVLENILIKINE
jgi:hypothetical protein